MRGLIYKNYIDTKGLLDLWQFYFSINLNWGIISPFNKLNILYINLTPPLVSEISQEYKNLKI